jgi:hypothetical protein
MELPVEIEVETGIASLKQAPLWKEQLQLLENPYLAPAAGSAILSSSVVRRPSFTATPLPELNVWPLGYNFLTGQPLRLRTSDGEVSWDLPGPLFDPSEPVATDEFNVPTELRTVIGALVGSDDEILDPGEVDGTSPCITCGYLIVSNPGAHPTIPPDGTVVGVPAVVDGVLFEGEVDPETGDLELEPVAELEVPVNEEHFVREADDLAGVPTSLQPFVGRPAAEILGKALFWDMQVGSDGVQACGSCHFNAGADNRTRNQLNPNHLGGDLTLDVRGANEQVLASDFPFHKLVDPDVPGESTNCGHTGQPACGPGVISDANDVMSSMGVRFRQFNDIPPIGSFIDDGVSGVPVLPPDAAPAASGGPNTDPIPAFQGVRRVEPRNTPTMHAAAFNFDNFWDGRARFNFNGGSVHGPSDPQFHVFVNDGGANGPLHGLPHPEDNELPLDQWAPEAGEEPVPARIKFSSLGSQAVGPPLSDFEMSFAGRNWPKIGKKLLQAGVTPLANQLVAVDDSRLGPFSNQGGGACAAGTTAPNKPGLCITYGDLIRAAFAPQLWANTSQRLVPNNNPNNPFAPDPFDDLILRLVNGPVDPDNRNQFTQMEANFSLFFGLSVQVYEQLLIPDDTLFDRFMDANPGVANAIGQPGEQGVLYPTLVPSLVTTGDPEAAPITPDCPTGTTLDGYLCLPDGFGPDEVFGFDIFVGGNATAALDTDRNPDGFGSNPFARTARCMLCHLGPEQTDHSNNIAHGIIKGDAEFEFPTPPTVIDPFGVEVPAPEPPGPIAAVAGLILSEEVTEGAAQDAVEVEPRNFATFDDPDTPWDDRIVAQPNRFSFGDQGVYNVGLRPNLEDLGRGGDDPFGWPLSLSVLTLKNIGGQDFEPGTVMANFDPADLEATFEETGDERFFEGTLYTLQSINPGFERDPVDPQMPAYMVPWMHGLPAGELHPQIDEMAGFAPNTLTPTNGGPAVEFPEVMFGADPHCGVYDPATFGAGPPNFGWGPRCPNNQSGVTGNFAFPVHGSWPDVNQVLKNGAFKAPSLRNVELTGPYFHTGSYLTLGQVVDFYLRGGDFPETNALDRDPHVMEIDDQAFGFGTTRTDFGFLGTPFDCSADPPNLVEFPLVLTGCGEFDFLIGTFADALPDGDFQYDFYPDTAHPLTPEPTFPSRDAALEDARDAVVKFLLSFTDPRVRFEQAPFDRPELFVPIDGEAPDNGGGRAELVSLSQTTCEGGVPATPNEQCFRHLPEVGAAGNPAPLSAFMGVTSNPDADCVTEISHFCP